MWAMCIVPPMKRTYLSCLISSILIIVVNESCKVSAVRAPPLVEINKCCRIGETFDRNKQCSIGGTVNLWWPPIYLIGKQSYFPKQGEAPRFLRAREYKQPDCENAELFLNSIALFSNGSLFLGERNLFIDIENYCVDKDVALVCLPNLKSADSLQNPIKLTKIRKCCSLNSIYLAHAHTCVPQSDETPQKLFETKNTSFIDLVFGFPRCSKATNNKYVIADLFHESNLNIDDGTYDLKNTNKVLASDEFCIDHTIQNANLVTGSVFACDDLVAIKEAPELKNEEVC